MNRPLKGVKVIDLTYYVAGPGATKMLADWGADVIKIEPEGGEPGRKSGIILGMPCDPYCNPYFNIHNFNKRDLAVNLKSEEGMAVLLRLIGESDVFVTNFRSGALKRLGLDYEALSAKYPHLIWAQVNGFGNQGPDKDKAGFDVVAFWAKSGSMMDLAEKDTSPVNPTLAFGDSTTAGSFAAGICAALYQKAKTGKGEKVMVSLLGQALWNLGPAVASVQWGDSYPKSRLAASSPVINSYKCKDGKWLFVAILDHERYYNSICEVIDRKDLMDDPRFCTGTGAVVNNGELIAIIAEGFARYTEEEMKRRLEKADIAHDSIQHIADAMNDPQALANDYVIDFPFPDGKVLKTSVTPVKFGDTTVDIDRHMPLVGEHTVDVMREIGFTDKEIQDLLVRKVVFEDKRENPNGKS